MVSVAVGVAGREVRINQSEDDGESQRQEDRRGVLAVESGPPMQGSGGGPRRTIRRIRPVWKSIPHRAPCLFAASRLLGSSMDAGPSAPRNSTSRLTSAAWEVP
jgi:hypothetical protein